MITLNGRYNFAHIMIDSCDESVANQIHQILNHPAFQGTQIRIMPDCHVGVGSVVGFTCRGMKNYVIPNIVGVDIGCGMLAANFGDIDIDFTKLDQGIRENIPAGFAARNKIHKKVEMLLPINYKITEVGKKIGGDINRFLLSLGTLGGGNHFIEVGRAPNNDKWVIIHTGSRNFGKMICDYHQAKAKKLMKQMFIEEAYKGLEFLPIENGGLEYLEDHNAAFNYSILNRDIILEEIAKILGREPEDEIVSIHNYIDIDGVIRKGATPASARKTVIIPFNMRDGIAICTGKGNTFWNESAPHGAGRIMSRRQAKENVSLDDYKKSMEGIYTTCVGQDTIDESPMAYKDFNVILEAIKDTVSVDFLLKPLYNFKAGGE